MDDHLSPLLEPQALYHIPDIERLLLVHVGDYDEYLAGHIPGAIYVDPKQLVCGIPPATGKLPDKTQLDELFSWLGLLPERPVVAYDTEGGGWAGRFIWTLDVVGHNYFAYLNGGLHAWKALNLPLKSGIEEPHSNDCNVTIHDKPIATAESILEHLGGTKQVIWDARSKEEFTGLRQTAKRNGHIPGAVLFPFEELIDFDNHTRLKDPIILSGQLEGLGIVQELEVVTHCHTHHRSGLSYLVARILGYQSLKAYDGSWSEWGNRDDTPIET